MQTDNKRRNCGRIVTERVREYREEKEWTPKIEKKWRGKV